MTGPLVSRPPYGEGKPRAPIAVAELPSGGPTDRGLPLDPGIPGQSTFNKPVDDTRKPENKDEPIYRVEGPDDMTKDRDRVDVNEDSKDQDTSYMGLGKPQGGDGKTKYPYRDEAPNAHNAADQSAFLAELWKLEGAQVRVLGASASFEVCELARIASTREQILTGLDPTYLERSKKCSASLKRADIPNLRWIFAVDCGNGPKAVKVRALPKGRNRAFAKLDLELSCSCKAWQWLGPEYHAQGEDYQLGNPVGTASTPNIRDPERDNRVCKHVAAALSMTKSWALPEAKMQRAVKKAMKLRRLVKKAMDRRAHQVWLAQQSLTENGLEKAFLAPHGILTAYIRAQGEVEGEAKYQLRKEGQEWPSKWIPTRDLAGAMGRLGFDTDWNDVPVKMQEWLREM